MLVVVIFENVGEVAIEERIFLEYSFTYLAHLYGGNVVDWYYID